MKSSSKNSKNFKLNTKNKKVKQFFAFAIFSWYHFIVARFDALD